MARPKNQKQLLEQSAKNYKKLFDVVDKFSQNLAYEFPPQYLNRNIRDVLMHLHHWHLMLIGWHQSGLNGIKPEMPAAGYTWKTVPELNREIQKMYTNVPLNKAISKLHKSHQEVMHIIEKEDADTLFEKKKLVWTGSTSFGAYLVSATSSHYDWAAKLIKKVFKQWD